MIRRSATRALPRTVRVVGYNDMKELLEGWADLFSDKRPEIQFEFDLPGTKFAPSALAHRESPFAPMGAFMTPSQLEEYRKVRGIGVDPIPLKVAHASLDPAALSGPTAVFVHHSNPVHDIDLAVLSGVLRGDLRTWGDVGATGEWANRTIRIAGVDQGAVIGLFVRDVLLNGGRITDRMASFPQSSDVVRAVGSDPLCIGYAAAMRANPSVRPLGLRTERDHVAVVPNTDAIRNGTYPLDRFLVIYLSMPASAVGAEFVGVALSEQGQRVVENSSLGYIPLSSSEVVTEMERLRKAVVAEP